MNAEELRIGNLVTDQFYESFKTTIDVDSIDDKGINLQICDDGNYPECAQRWIEPEYEFEELQPILLTEEWLVKFGLTKLTKYNFLLGCYELLLNPITNEWNLCLKGGIVARLKYVHQLQNLYFCLCNKELTIKTN